MIPCHRRRKFVTVANSCERERCAEFRETDTNFSRNTILKLCSKSPIKRNNPSSPFRRFARIDNHIQLSFLILVHLIIPRRPLSFHFIDIRIQSCTVYILFLSNKIAVSVDRLSCEWMRNVSK